MSTPVHYLAKNFAPWNVEWSELVPLIGPVAAPIAHRERTLSAFHDPEMLLSPCTINRAGPAQLGGRDLAVHRPLDAGRAGR